MTSLQRGSLGSEVGRWQTFLVGRGFLNGHVDGVFGADTARATARFQAARQLVADGIVGPATLGAARALGFSDDTVPREPPPVKPERLDTPGVNDFFPPKPSFLPLANNEARQQLFGRFAYRAAPQASNPEAIEITDHWAEENIVSVVVPGLKGIPIGEGRRLSSGRMSFHRKAAAQLIALWQAWSDAGLLAGILSFDGAFAARFVRGSHNVLSNHAFGSAFDINAFWNPIKKPPAPIQRRGSVMQLVALANQHGFYWGGHFQGRPDGMHFEVAVVR